MLRASAAKEGEPAPAAGSAGPTVVSSPRVEPAVGQPPVLEAGGAAPAEEEHPAAPRRGIDKEWLLVGGPAARRLAPPRPALPSRPCHSPPRPAPSGQRG